MQGESWRPGVEQICLNSDFKWLFPFAQRMSLPSQDLTGHIYVKKEALLAFKVIGDGVKRTCVAGTQFQPKCFSLAISTFGL